VTGTDDTADDDALYVLTAALLTPARFPAVLGDDFPEACSALGLAPWPEGYGLVMGQDGNGARWTVVVDDVSLVAVAIASWDCGMEYDLSPGEDTVVSALPGWPMALAVVARGVPAPHDPEPEPGDRSGGAQDALRLPLTPPDTTAWGPAQRRLGADEVAHRWASWRDRADDEEVAPQKAETPPDSAAPGDPGASGEPGTTGTPEEFEAAGEPSRHAGVPEDTESDGATEEADDAAGPVHEGAPTLGAPAHEGVLRVLRELRAYVEAGADLPLGRIRSAFAPGDARMLRADGPGWSFVARTDDTAFVLLDEEPGEVLPLGRGPELPGLLRALDDIAVRPAR
jgi:hypothetical protein